jgi:hypothetical protein
MQTDALDAKVRRFVYDQLMSTCKAPTVGETATALGAGAAEMQASFQRLADGHIFILQTNGEIMAANPFANVPTTFVVESNQRRWSAMCIWDALGIPAMLEVDAVINTSCGDCNDRIELNVQGGELQTINSVVHFAVPARQWWNNIVFS